MLVNNAGVEKRAAFLEIRQEDWERQLDVNLSGTFYCTQAAAREMAKRRNGRIANIASVSGLIGPIDLAAYGVSKAGVIGLSAALRQELREEKVDTIHICTVEPTTFDTPFFEHAARYTGHEAAPTPPIYDPKDMVDTIVRLATDPEDEVRVGTAAKIMNFAHHLFPGVVEAVMARRVHKTHYEQAPPASKSSGALHEPMPTGTDVSGGHRK